MKRALAVLLFSATLLLLGQTTGSVNIIGGKLDLSGAVHTLPTIVVALVGSLPSTGCTPGELAMVTSATPGQQLYQNSGSGTCTWTQQPGGSGTVSGTTNRVSKFTSSTAVGNSSMTDDGTNAVQIPNGWTLMLNGGGDIQVANNAVTGTTINKMACQDAAGLAIVCPTSNPGPIIGVVVAGAGTTGSAQICTTGRCLSTFDNSSTANDWGILSTSVAGDIHDTGQSAITGNETAGVQNVIIDGASGGAAGTANIRLSGLDAFSATGKNANLPKSAELLGTNPGGVAQAQSLNSGDIYVGNGSNLPADVTMSGSCTLANTGAITCNFTGVGSGTNTTAAMLVGAGGSLAPTSTGIVVNSGSFVNSASNAPISIVPLTGWTIVNGAYLGDFATNGFEVGIAENNSVNWRVITKTLPAPPYTIIGKYTVQLDNNNLSANAFPTCMMLYDGTKLEGICGDYAGGRAATRTIATVTSGSSVINSTAGALGQAPAFRIQDNGTTRTLAYWTNGGWTVLTSEATNTFLTPTSAGFGGVNNTANTDLSLLINYWCVTATITPSSTSTCRN